MAAKPTKASEKRLKWWYFRPWSPLVFCAFAGWFISSLPAVTHSAIEKAWADAQPLIWTSVGAVVGGLWEWLQPKRWRPRFSVRTLLILVTLGCAYLACWHPTKRLGAHQVMTTTTMMNECDDLYFETRAFIVLHPSADDKFTAYTRPKAVLPCIIEVECIGNVPDSDTRHYYFWFFGYVAKLPFERDDPRFIFGRDGGVI